MQSAMNQAGASTRVSLLSSGQASCIRSHYQCVQAAHVRPAYVRKQIARSLVPLQAVCCFFWQNVASGRGPFRSIVHSMLACKAIRDDSEHGTSHVTSTSNSGASSSDGHGYSATSGACTSEPTDVLHWHVVLPTPGGGVVGTGKTGDVLAARLDGIPAVVKYVATGSDDACALVHEAHVYQAPGMQALQDVYIPRLLYAGPASRGRYVLVTSRVFGRQLSGEDAGLLPQALAALRAVHRAGYLHGDVRLPNFMVASGEDGPQVVALDFGCAEACSSVEAMEEEEAQLCCLLGSVLAD